jgi:hypothetical protein
MRLSVNKRAIVRTSALVFVITAFAAAEARAACSATAAAWANRDDDGDGICNGVDDCPYESDAAQTKAPNGGGAACQVQAIAVPWVPTNVALPHYTYTGRSITIKGIARYAGAGAQYRWDFGDGTSTSYAAIGDPYNLGVAHTYTGNVNQLFVATLYVKNSAGTVSTSTYPVQIYISTDLTDPNQMDVRIAVAEDEALWNMHVALSRSQYPDGANGYNQRYAYYVSDQIGTCASVDAFQLHGSKPLQPYSTDPYVEDSQEMLAYMLYNSSIQSGINTASPNPVAGTGDTFGVMMAGGSIYNEGICGLAFASSGSPGRVAQTGPAGVFNATYGKIAQDVADWLAWAQNDGTNSVAGGWYYSANTGGADGSTNQWPILSLGAQEANMGAVIPAFVRTQVPYFVSTVHYLGADSYYGGYGYNVASTYPNVAKTAGGIMANFFVGNGNNFPDVQAGWGHIYTRWTVPGNGWTDYNLGNSYAMYDVMKATQQANPKLTRIPKFVAAGQQNSAGAAAFVSGGTGGGVSSAVTTFDWYYTPAGQTQQGLATNIVTRQAADGSITDNQYGPGISTRLSTAWDTLILMKAVANVPPKAVICNCSAQWPSNAPITLDGSCSVEPDASKLILNPTGYKWDYAYNGGAFVQSLDSNNFPVQGPTVVKPDGFLEFTIDGNGNPTAYKHTVALQVTDNTPASQGGPQSNITTCNVIIKPPPHCPQANIGGPYIGFVNAPVQLDASGSTQVDGDPMTYAWDFSNLNVFGDSTAIKPTHTWTSNGTYPIELRVTNLPPPSDAGVVPSCTVTAYTTVIIGTHAPVASAGGPYTATQGETITLDGSGSYDPDGNAFTYAWDLSGNGLYTDSTIQKPTYTVPASTVIGTSFSVCLRVADLNKTSSPACATVTTIAHHTPPTCLIAPVSVQACTGGFMSVTVDGSHSSDPNGDHFTYAWSSTDCPPFSNATASQPNITFQSFQGGSVWEPASVGPSCTPSCTATLTVTNTYGSNSCSQKVNFADSMTPAFSPAPAAKTIECDANAQANVTAWLASAAGGDLCTPPQSPTVISNNYRATAGACGGVGTSGGTGGTVAVVFTATDPCDSKFTSDTLPPVLTLPANISAEATSAAGASVNYAVSALDAATGVTAVTCSQNSGTTFAVGVTTVTCSSTDVGGHKVTGTFTVTITDTTPPALNLPANLTVEASSAAGAVAAFTATASDFVDGNVTTTCVPASGSTFAIGTAQVTCTATDKHNNTARGTFTVTVSDTTKPVVTVPANKTIEATSANGATVSFVSTATDAVDGAPAVTCAPVSGSTFAIGQSTVTCSATDTHGNKGTNSFTITVQDTTAPVVTVPANLTIEATTASGAVATFTASASDIVNGNTPVICSPASGTTFAIGTTTVTCTSTDGSSNKGTNSFTVTVRDTTPPVLTVPANLVAEATKPEGAVITFNATASDLVSGSPAVTCAPVSGSTFALGSTTVTCSTQDAHLNASTKTFTVTVQDTTAPTLTVPADMVIEATGAAGAVATYTTSATDVVSLSTAVTCVPASGSTFKLGLTTVTCASTDAAHNTATKTFRITVRSTIAPTVIVPKDVVAEATGPNGTIETFMTSAVDVVDGYIAAVCVPASGSAFAIGTTKVTCTATDSSTNTGSASFTVTVSDHTAPALTGVSAGGVLTIEASSGQGATVVDYGIHANDIVDGVIAVGCSPMLPMTFPLGETPVACTSTDLHGTIGRLTFSVAVVDTTPPAVVCPGDISIAANGPLGAANWNVSEPTSDAIAAFLKGSSATDLVDPIPAMSNDAPWMFPVGHTTAVTFSATDAHRNTGKCTSHVTVYEENEWAPTLTCPSGTSILQSNGIEMDWSAVFHHPVSVQLLVVNAANGTHGNPLSLAEGGDRQVQMSSSALATGGYAVRVRAMDTVTGMAVDCNQFLSVSHSDSQTAKSVSHSTVPAILIAK